MRVLIVDDEPLVRKSLARACRARGHEVIEAVDGASGLVAWKESNPEMVFLDVLMPGMSGPEVLQEVSRLGVTMLKGNKRSKVILMSAYSGEHNIETAQQNGADLFVPKPFDDIFAVVARAEQLMGQGAAPGAE